MYAGLKSLSNLLILYCHSKTLLCMQIADHLKTTSSRSVYGLYMQDLYFGWILEELEETLEFIENSLLLIIMSYSADTS